jgi:hypothetical protein
VPDETAVTIDHTITTNIVGQLVLGFARGRWPQLPPPGHMRGVDFYSARQFVNVLEYSAQLFRDRHGYLPRLESPASFNEHIFARKFFGALPIPSVADKLAAREFARARVGDELIKPIVWNGNDPAELFRAPLPSGRFMLKANHGSGFNMVVNLPDDLSTRRAEIDATSRKWLATRFGFDWGEWQYCTFAPKLFLEEFLAFNGSTAPDEYGVLCFRGQARLIIFHRDPLNTHRNTLYDLAWNQLPVLYGYPEEARPCPENLGEIIRVAEEISKDFDFARVDLNSDGRHIIKFGEITFTPNNAMRRFSDFQFDLDLGRNFLR